MPEEKMRYLGYEWLRRYLSLTAFEIERPARVRPVTRVLHADGLLAVPAHVTPAEGDVLDHMLFALKHEGTNLQVLTQAMHLGPSCCRNSCRSGCCLPTRPRALSIPS